MVIVQVSRSQSLLTELCPCTQLSRDTARMGRVCETGGKKGWNDSKIVTNTGRHVNNSGSC